MPRPPRAVVLPVVALAGLAITAALAPAQPPLPGEAAAFEAVNGAPDWLEPPLVVVMQLGLLGVALAVAVVAGVARRSWRLALAAAGAAYAAWLVSGRVKDVFERARPDESVVDLVARHEASGFGYTSTHAAVAAALATVAIVVVPSRWRWLAVGLAAGVGLARVYVGVHYPLDVVGGAALGVLAGSAAGALLR